MAGQHDPIGPRAPGLDAAALSSEDGPCRALADEPHGFQTEPARYVFMVAVLKPAQHSAHDQLHAKS